MPNAHDVLFRTLADPTRRAIFERLCRDGEQTVGALTARAGVSQPAVSKHLGVLKQAGLVRDRHEGRQTHYSAQLGALAPLIDWTSQMAGFWQSRFDTSKISSKGWTNERYHATETLSVVVDREIPFPPEKIWRALTQPHLIEEWLMKNDFKPVVDHRFNLRARLGRRRLPGPGNRAEQDAVLHVGRLWPRERRHLDSYPDEHRDPPAHGAVGLPAGSAAGLPGRQGRVAAVLCKAGAGAGAAGVIAGTIQGRHRRSGAWPFEA